MLQMPPAAALPVQAAEQLRILMLPSVQLLVEHVKHHLLQLICR
jgi:hypothetical protein